MSDGVDCWRQAVSGNGNTLRRTVEDRDAPRCAVRRRRGRGSCYREGPPRRAQRARGDAAVALSTTVAAVGPAGVAAAAGVDALQVVRVRPSGGTVELPRCRGPRALHRRDHPVDGLHPGRRPGARGAPLVDSRAGRPEHRGRRARQPSGHLAARPAHRPGRRGSRPCCGLEDGTPFAVVTTAGPPRRCRGRRRTRTPPARRSARGPQRIGLPVRWCLGCARRRGRRHGRAGAGATHGRRAGRRAGAVGAGRGGRSGADGARRHRRPARGAAPGRRRAHRDADEHSSYRARQAALPRSPWTAAATRRRSTPPVRCRGSGSEASRKRGVPGAPPAEAESRSCRRTCVPSRAPAPAPVRRSASGSTGSAGSGGDDRSRSFLFSIAAALAAIAILDGAHHRPRRERRARRRPARSVRSVRSRTARRTRPCRARPGPTPPSRRSRFQPAAATAVPRTSGRASRARPARRSGGIARRVARGRVAGAGVAGVGVGAGVGRAGGAGAQHAGVRRTGARHAGARVQRAREHLHHQGVHRHAPDGENLGVPSRRRGAPFAPLDRPFPPVSPRL